MALFGCWALAPALAQNSTFEFKVATTKGANALWRVDRLSGEVGMCYFEQARRKRIGALKCTTRGPGAGVQNEPVPFGLCPAVFDDESAVYRINLRIGSASLCYDIKRKDGHQVICTESNR